MRNSTKICRFDVWNNAEVEIPNGKKAWKNHPENLDENNLQTIEAQAENVKTYFSEGIKPGNAAEKRQHATRYRRFHGVRYG